MDCVGNLFYMPALHYIQLAECLVFKSGFLLLYCICRYGYVISYYMSIECISTPVCRGGINNINGSLSDGNESTPEGLWAEIRQIQLSEPWWKKKYIWRERNRSKRWGLYPGDAWRWERTWALSTKARSSKTEQFSSDNIELKETF